MNGLHVLVALVVVWTVMAVRWNLRYRQQTTSEPERPVLVRSDCEGRVTALVPFKPCRVYDLDSYRERRGDAA